MTIRTADEIIGEASRALVLGIGGGGDVVGALAVAKHCEALGTDFVVGGVAWERWAVDPYPGPRSLDQVSGGTRIASTALLADAATTTPEGTRFCESGIAELLERPTVLVDVTAGARSAAEGIVAAATELDCDLVLFVDVGGDALADGSEPGLASPLCDAVMLAAAAHAAPEVPTLGAIFGIGCDGELTPEEVMERIASLAGARAWLGAWALPLDVAELVEAAGEVAPTEASLQPARCARGEIGTGTIRGGRRTVPLGPLGALTFFFDPLAGPAQLPLAAAVADADDIEEARGALAALGIRTELDYERDRSAGGPAPP